MKLAKTDLSLNLFQPATSAKSNFNPCKKKITEKKDKRSHAVLPQSYVILTIFCASISNINVQVTYIVHRLYKQWIKQIL